MKTYSHLFDRIVSFENLLAAANKAAAGKREEFRKHCVVRRI
jgi:hypothetical protein